MRPIAGPEHRAARTALKEIHSQTLVWLTLANLVLHVAGR